MLRKSFEAAIRGARDASLSNLALHKEQMTLLLVLAARQYDLQCSALECGPSHYRIDIKRKVDNPHDLSALTMGAFWAI
jgi:hypothetical protein